MTTTATTLFEARKNLKKITDDVADFDDHVIITKPKNRNVVIISEKEFQSWKETLYLLGTEANRKNLDESLNQLKKANQLTIKDELIGFYFYYSFLIDTTMLTKINPKPTKNPTLIDSFRNNHPNNVPTIG